MRLRHGAGTPWAPACLGGIFAAARAGGALALAQAPVKKDPFLDSRRQVMENKGDVEYISYFTLGHQTIAGVFDTGSFELLVFSANCKTCGIAGKYDPALSSSHKAGFLNTVQQYGSGDTSSQEASDLVSIGPFSERKQMFWEVTDARMPRLRTTHFQAVIGIGPPETAAADAWLDAKKIIDAVQRYYKEDQLPPKETRDTAKEVVKGALELSYSPALLDNLQVKTFSICMGAQPGSDGYLTWHDEVHSRKPNLFMRVPIAGDHSWSASLRNVRLTQPGGVNASLGCSGDEGCTVLIDSGTSLVAAPADVIKQIQDIIDKLDGDCRDLTSFPTLTFEMGGNFMSLPPDAYIAAVVGTVPEYLQNRVHVGEERPSWRKRSQRARSVVPRNISVDAPSAALSGDSAAANSCKMLLMESYMESDSGGPLWIFGFPFFRKYYSTFSLGEDSASRAMYVAEAGDDCRPAETSSLYRKLPHLRHIDVSKLAVPVHIGHSRVRRI